MFSLDQELRLDVVCVNAAISCCKVPTQGAPFHTHFCVDEGVGESVHPKR